MPASKRTVLNNFLDVVKYCKKYDEWPKLYTRDIGDKEKTSIRLYRWLYDNGFNRANMEFTYSDFKMEDGSSIKEVLEELYLEYAPEIKMANEVETYCKKYGKMPRLYHHKTGYKLTEHEQQSSKLYVWMRENGLLEDTKNSFRLDDYEEIEQNEILSLEDFKWVLVVEKMKEIYEKYGSSVKGSTRHFIDFVDRLELYCTTYNAWPTKSGMGIDEREKNESNFLYKKLDYLEFKKSTGKLGSLKIVNGVDYTQKIEGLFQRYATNVPGSKAYIVNNVSAILKYCQKYYEWPRRRSDLTTEQNKQAYKLAIWLSKVGFPDSFIYADYKFKSGITAGEVLDTYYVIYAKYRNKNADATNPQNSFNRWVAISSRDTATALFTYSALLRLTMLNNNVKRAEYYRENFKKYLDKQNIDLDVTELEYVFSLSYDIQQEYFNKLAQKYKLLKDKTMSTFYNRLSILISKQMKPQNKSYEK